MATKDGRRGPYAKTARVREHIIEAATLAFSQSGFHGTTMKEIAERSGISQRGLVHHFASKDDLLTEVLKYHDAQNAKQVPLTRGGAELVSAMLQVVRHNANVPGLIELYTILNAEATAPAHPAHEHHARRYAEFRQFIVESFELVEAAGELESAMPPAIVAEVFIAVVDGLQIQWLYDKSVDIEGGLTAFLRTICPRVIEREIDAPALAALGE